MSFNLVLALQTALKGLLDEISRGEVELQDLDEGWEDHGELEMSFGSL